VNANIGTSTVRCSVAAEIETMQIALDAGADAIMDLSTGGNLDAIRAKLAFFRAVRHGADYR
jgi:phosphomethylpyrimidine synthase